MTMKQYHYEENGEIVLLSEVWVRKHYYPKWAVSRVRRGLGTDFSDCLKDFERLYRLNEEESNVRLSASA